MSSIGSANIAGLASGLNFNSIVSQLMAVEQQKVSLLQTQQAQQQLTQTALNTLNSSLYDLRTQAQALSDPSTFLSYSSSLTSDTSTDPTTLMTVTPGATAAPGTHTINITNIAAAEQFVSSASVASSSTTALGLSGDFTITGQASSAQTVTVAATDSLSDIVTKINALNSGNNATGVTASVLQAGTSDFRLVITADDTGATGTGLTDGTNTPLASLNINPASATTVGKDASITVDGIAVTRSSNTITDVLSGYTIDLLKADAVTPATVVTVTTAADKTAIKAEIQGFVDAYNKVMKFINSEMAFDPKTQTSGILASNTTVRSIQSQLAAAILQSVPGLASDRNSMVLVGIAPDSNGQLQIDDTMLNSFLDTDPTAVANVFGASGSSTNSNLSLLTPGLNSVSGSYAVNITQAATQASITGSVALAPPSTITGSGDITVTDGLGQQATVSLASGVDTLTTTVAALNTAFATTATEQRKMSTALTASGSPATAATTLQSLGLGVATNDTISIIGTTRGGTAVNSSFTVLDPATDTVGDLLSAIQVAFNQTVTASIDASGNINITDNSDGTSSTTFNLTANNEGGGTLSFGTESQVTAGRYAMNLSAVATAGNKLQIISNDYGATQSLSVTVPTGTDVWGVSGLTSTGTDVAGTIGGQAATGAGQILTGTAGNSDGMALLYTGSTTGSIGTLTASLGIGSVYDGLVDVFSNPVTGLVQNDVFSAQNIYDSLQSQIDDMNARIKREADNLTKSFQQMEQIIGQLNSTNSYIAQQFSSTATSSSGTSTA